MTGFPLLRLPLLAFIPVLEAMQPWDLINFSLTSNLMKAEVKRLTPLHVQITNDASADTVTLWRLKNPKKPVVTYSIKSSDQKNGPLANLRLLPDGSIEVLSRNRLQECRALLSLLLSTLRIVEVSQSFVLGRETGMELFADLIDLTRDTNLTWRRLEIVGGMQVEPSLYQALIHSFTTVPSLELRIEMGAGFKYDGSKGYPKNRFFATHAAWVSSADLEEMAKCKQLLLSGLRLTAEETNLFLKKWVSGEVGSDLLLTVENVDMETVLEGLKTEQRNKIVPVHNRNEPVDCQEITRNSDGLKMTLLWTFPTDDTTLLTMIT